MKRRKLPLKTLLILAGFLVVAATALLPIASATNHKPAAIRPTRC